MQNARNGLWVDSIHSSTVVDPSIDNTVGVRPKKILVVPRLLPMIGIELGEFLICSVILFKLLAGCGLSMSGVSLVGGM